MKCYTVIWFSANWYIYHFCYHNLVIKFEQIFLRKYLCILFTEIIICNAIISVIQYFVLYSPCAIYHPVSYIHWFYLNKSIYLGDVCVFYEDGGLKFVYSGHSGGFLPTDICCDALCNIIFTNCCDSSVHVIDSEGAFLKYLLTSDRCVPDLTAVALYRDSLWVGSYSGEVRVYRYKYW